MKTLAVLVSPVLVAGCFLFPRRDPTRYYTLHAVTAPAATSSGRRIGVGPVTLPGYLDRPGLATRVDATQIRYANDEVWADSLLRQFTRTLAEDLGLGLGTTQVTVFPWYPGVPLDAAVVVTVLAFECDANGAAHLDAVWSIRDPATNAVRRDGRTTVAEPVDGRGAEAAVGALSRVVARLADDLGAAIRGAGAR